MKLLLLTKLAMFTAVAGAAPAVTVHGIVTEGVDTVTLDLMADINSEISLRSFGLSVEYDAGLLTVNSMGRYDGIWYLSADGGASTQAYSDPAVLKPGLLEIMGARFNGQDPDQGVTGQQVLLGTIQFTRTGNETPSFALGLARAEPFVNFALADGTPVDANIDGLGGAPTLFIVKPVEDLDKDLLPDEYEMATFGNLRISTGDSDTDGDGASDYQEWLAATDPKDSSSLLKLVMTMQSDGSKIFEWNGQPGRVYSLMRSQGLQSFSPVITGLAGESSQQVTESADDVSAAFYRLEVEYALGR